MVPTCMNEMKEIPHEEDMGVGMEGSPYPFEKKKEKKKKKEEKKIHDIEGNK